MSCIRFTPSAQRERLRAEGPALSNEDAAVLHLSPPVTAGKLARLRLLAEHSSPGIRESVATNRHAPADLLEALAADPVDAVRSGVARNESSPPRLLAALATDRSERVRSWLVLNPGTAEDVLERLAGDADAGVRRLVGWRRSESAQPSPSR